MHWVQTGLLTVCTAGVIACFKFLWAINTFIATTTIRDDVQDKWIAEYRVDIGLNQKQGKENEKNIAILFALLPEKLKEDKINKPH